MLKAPKTIDLLKELAILKASRGLSFWELLRDLNKHLTPFRQIKSDKQLERWMHTDRTNWPEPSAEIILAVQKYLEQSAYRG